jgi:hypothetical protein
MGIRKDNQFVEFPKTHVLTQAKQVSNYPCVPNNINSRVSSRLTSTPRLIPIISLDEAYQIKKSAFNFDKSKFRKHITVDKFNKSIMSPCLFAIAIEEKCIWPIFNIGDLAIIDADLLPKKGDYLLLYLPLDRQMFISRYHAEIDCVLEKNTVEDTVSINAKRNQDVIILGVICELRKYY